MAVLYRKQITLTWIPWWTVLLSMVLMWLPPHHCMITSDATCAGHKLSITCTSGWLIHIVYETYSYSTSPCSADLVPGTVICTKAEFLNPISVGHCNGQSSCVFTVPVNTTISSCKQVATALSIHYKCIPETSVFTICSDVTFHQTEQLYLATPDFPSNILGRQKNCSCSLIGRNINGTVLQQTRELNSSVILMLSTDRGTHHINGLNILNTHIFSNFTKINLILENQRDEQVFKIWLGFRGSEMSLKCQYDKPYPVTTTGEVTVDTTMSTETIQNQGYTSIVNMSFSLDSSISATPTQTTSSQSNAIQCSETKLGQTIKCKSDTVEIGLSSGDSLSGARSTLTDILPTTTLDISSQIKSTMQVTMVTNVSPTKSLIFTKSIIQTKTVLPIDNTQVQSSTAVGNVETSQVLESLDPSTITESPGISTRLSRSTITESPGISTLTESVWTSVTNTVVTGMSSSILNSNQTTAGLQPKSADEDVALLVIVGCLAFILLVAMIVFTIVMWRRANSKQYVQEDTHIYDAYHHDNGNVGPDSLGDNQSYHPDDQESILI